MPGGLQGTATDADAPGATQRPRGDRLRMVALCTIMAGLILTLGYALRPDAPSQRKLLGEVVALQLYAGLDDPPRSASIPPEEDTSTAAPGKPDGYRRAVRFHDPALPCPENTQPATCGAKLEIFRHRSAAIARHDTLANAGEEHVVRRGALVLRISPDLPGQRRALYRSEFTAALDRLVGLRELARLEHEA